MKYKATRIVWEDPKKTLPDTDRDVIGICGKKIVFCYYDENGKWYDEFSHRNIKVSGWADKPMVVKNEA